MKIPKEVIEFLGRENIKIRDLAAVQQKITTLIAGGAELLQVITDFDQTITKFHHNGELCDSTYSVLTNSSIFSDDFKSECTLSCNKYGPIEINHGMTIEERIPYMLQWQEEFLQSLIKSNVNQSLIKKATNESKSYLRDNAKTVLAKLDEASVPVLVFSAGIEDIILGILEKHDVQISSNVKIVSNKMEFDQDEFLVSFRQPTIHSFNKRKSFLAEKTDDHFSEVGHRTNVVLLGDNIGDIHMSDGMNPHETTILRIGFLENNGRSHRESFLEGYDIVIEDDQSWDLFHVLLQHILQEKCIS